MNKSNPNDSQESPAAEGEVPFTDGIWRPFGAHPASSWRSTSGWTIICLVVSLFISSLLSSYFQDFYKDHKGLALLILATVATAVIVTKGKRAAPYLLVISWLLIIERSHLSLASLDRLSARIESVLTVRPPENERKDFSPLPAVKPVVDSTATAQLSPVAPIVAKSFSPPAPTASASPVLPTPMPTAIDDAKMKAEMAFERSEVSWRSSEYNGTCNEFEMGFALSHFPPYSQFSHYLAACICARRTNLPGLSSENFLDTFGWTTPFSAYAVLCGYTGFLRTADSYSAIQLVDKSTGKVDAVTWPGPIINYLHGQMSRTQLISSVQGNLSQQSEACTFMGIQELYSGNRSYGIQLLQWVEKWGQKDGWIYNLAISELGRVSVNPQPIVRPEVMVLNGSTDGSFNPSLNVRVSWLPQPPVLRAQNHPASPPNNSTRRPVTPVSNNPSRHP